MSHLNNPRADEQLDVKHPVLDLGFVSLVDYMGGDQRIAEAAWVSSIDEVDAEKKTAAAQRRIIRYMMRHRHTSPFEQVELVFRCKMPIFVARQWVRHRTASLNEMSGRYRILPPHSYTPQLERLGGKGKTNKQGTEGELDDTTKRSIQYRLAENQKEQWELYEWLTDTGLANEIARLNLPLAAYTEWYWKIDLHNLMHFLGLRLDEHAQWEIRQYAAEMYRLTKMVAPVACEAFEDYKLYAVTFSRMEMIAMTKMAGGLSAGQSMMEAELSNSERNEFMGKLGGMFDEDEVPHT